MLDCAFPAVPDCCADAPVAGVAVETPAKVAGPALLPVYKPKLIPGAAADFTSAAFRSTLADVSVGFSAVMGANRFIAGAIDWAVAKVDTAGAGFMATPAPLSGRRAAMVAPKLNPPAAVVLPEGTMVDAASRCCEVVWAPAGCAAAAAPSAADVAGAPNANLVGTAAALEGSAADVNALESAVGVVLDVRRL